MLCIVLRMKEFLVVFKELFEKEDGYVKRSLYKMTVFCGGRWGE